MSPRTVPGTRSLASRGRPTGRGIRIAFGPVDLELGEKERKIWANVIGRMGEQMDVAVVEAGTIIHGYAGIKAVREVGVWKTPQQHVGPGRSCAQSVGIRFEISR